MTNRTTKIDPSVAKARQRIGTITNVMAKVNVSADTAELWDNRRQRLHEAVKILTKPTR